MPNPRADFYRVNFEKEISVQGRNTIFLSIEADETTPWAATDYLWVAPIIQPQTFVSKFESWTYYPTYAPAVPLPATGIFYFKEAGFAKTGPLGAGGWEAVQIGDDVKAVSMYRRTLNGESTATPGSGPLDVIRFDSKILNKGITQIQNGPTTYESVYFIEIDKPGAGGFGPTEAFLLQVGNWSVDNNWHINQTNAAEIAQRTQKSATAGGNVQYINFPGGPSTAANQFDGQTPTLNWPTAAAYYDRIAPGSAYPWAVYKGGNANASNTGRITWRIDYDGVADSHLKINFLIAKTVNSTITINPNNFPAAKLAELSNTGVVYGQKRPLSALTALSPYFVDYQEVHIFGYTETPLKTSRTTYQNLQPPTGKELYDDFTSYALLKTNPKLTGNIKLTVDSGGALSLNTIDASLELSDAKYKKFAVSSNSTYQTDLHNFLNKGNFPADVLFQLYQKDNQYLNTKRTFADQYDNFYNYGVEQLRSKFYDEDFSFFAPIWLRKNLPDFFVVFRLDHPLNPLSYTEATNLEKFEEFFRGARIIKTYDMRSSSPLGTYIRKLTEDPRFADRPLQVSFDDDTQTTWSGIDYTSGSITGKGEFLYDFWNEDNRILDFEDYITGGFERNGLISTNLLNLEFLFNDDEATPYTINRYFGLYVTENQLAEFEIDSTILGAIAGQTPAPKKGVDGEPFSLQPFFQTNATGIKLPVNYYHNPPVGAPNTTPTPGNQGFTEGKFPLPSMVEDSLRIFYVKDRNGLLKRVNQTQEVNYAAPGSPDFRRVTEIQLFDTYENISDYGGITQISSQARADLLSGGNAQCVLQIEDIAQSGKPIADSETIDIVFNKLSAEKRDYIYEMECTLIAATILTFTIKVPEYGSTVPTLFYAEIDVDTSATTTGYVDSYLQFNIDNATITVGDVWDITVADGNVTSANSVVTNPLASITFYGQPNYTSYRWRLEANSLGLRTGTAWDYPVMDPQGRDYLNAFCNDGTPEEVARAIAECANSFENKIVQAYAVGSAVYFKSLKNWEDGNQISIKRNYVINKSIINNLGYYEKGNVKEGNLTVDYQTLTGTNIESLFTVKRPSAFYSESFNYIDITPLPGSWGITLRRGVDITNPTSSGTAYYYTLSLANPILSEEDFDLNVSTISALSTGIIHFVFGDAYSEQYFIGGVRRNRARAKVEYGYSQRYFEDRKKNISGNTTVGSYVITGVPDIGGIYVGASVQGVGIPEGATVLEITAIPNTIKISRAATADSVGLPIVIGELSRLNSSVLYQQWFQSQKGLYSRLKGWNSQGKLIYSLPDMESGVATVGLYSILQIEKENAEFYATSDSRILAFEVYRPTFGILSMLPIKTFDVDTFFSEYSYSPMIELFRYYNREETSGSTLNNINLEPLVMNMGENYQFILDVDRDYVAGPANETVDVQLEVEFYDQNDKEWKYIDTITSKIYTKPSSAAGGNLTPERVEGLKSILINTYYPAYFYDTLEVPNDYVGTGGDGPYNYANPDSGAPIDQINAGPQYTLAGTRNYVRKKLYSSAGIECAFTKARISKITFWSNVSTSALPPVFNYVAKVQGANYYKDGNIQTFSGFSSLADFVTLNDQGTIQKYNEEQSFEKFTYQMLLSEYDRLRENSQKDLAVKSKVVPYILKWVQEGTDARDNYYRLNNSSAFGITNFSPDSEVDFTEPLLLTHEFPYLDAVPKDYPEEQLESSRSYFFQKLSDVAANGKTWYELLSTDNTEDWFGKYFVIGYPNELSPTGEPVTKNREERYTFFKYIDGLDLSQTLFRGAKINVVDYDTTVNPKTPVNESSRFDQYRFAAIARQVAYHNFEEDKPIQIEVIENSVYKTILIVITLYVQDYRLSAGLGDYSFFYYALDQLRNSMQTQTVGGYGTWSQFMKARPGGYSITTPDGNYPMEMPYTADGLAYGGFLNSTNYFVSATNPRSKYAEDIPQALSISRYRQLLLGGGRLELDDTRLGGKLWIAAKTSLTSQAYSIYQPLKKPADGSNEYPFSDNSIDYYPVYKEVFPAIDTYRNAVLYFLGGNNQTAGTGIPIFTAPPTPSNLPFAATPMTVDGALSEISVSSFTTQNVFGVPTRFAATSYIVDTLQTVEDIKLDTIRLSTPRKYPIFFNPAAPLQKIQAIVNTIDVGYGIASLPTAYPPYSIVTNAINFLRNPTYKLDQTHNLRGGSLFYQYRKNFLSYANIFKMFNADSDYISYAKISEAGATAPIRFKGAITVGSTALTNIFAVTPAGVQLSPGQRVVGIGIPRGAKIAKVISATAVEMTVAATTSTVLIDVIAPVTTDFQLQFVTFDKLKKKSKYYYKDDTDKPLEYENTDFIGYDPVKTAEQEYEFRHRGAYEPKTLEVISFWAREDESFTQHFEADYVLRNTHINGSSGLAGLLRNYFYNKVSTEEVLRIGRTSAYKSLYPLIGEIAIDKRSLNALDSSWDSAFYRKYDNTTSYADVPGTEEMQETKVFLAGKAMVVPKAFDIGVFNDSEITFTVAQPQQSIGVASLATASVENQSLQSKPVLTILLDLKKSLQRALLEGMLANGSFDEFTWFNTLGIPAIEYTASELQTLKTEYINKNIIPLYEISQITLYANVGEGLPIVDFALSESEKAAAGYRADANVKVTSSGELVVTLEKTLDTKAANAYSISAVLKRI